MQDRFSHEIYLFICGIAAGFALEAVITATGYLNAGSNHALGTAITGLIACVIAIYSFAKYLKEEQP